MWSPLTCHLFSQDAERSMGDRSTAIGSLAECVNGMEGAVGYFAEAVSKFQS